MIEINPLMWSLVSGCLMDRMPQNDLCSNYRNWTRYNKCYTEEQHDDIGNMDQNLQQNYNYYLLQMSMFDRVWLHTFEQKANHTVYMAVERCIVNLI